MLFSPALRAFAQLDDPAFLGAVLRAVGWAALVFVILAAGLGWLGHDVAAQRVAGHGIAGFVGWLGGLLGIVGAALAALVLYVPLATAIAYLFADRVATAVERRHYPGLPPAIPAALATQVWDGAMLALRVLAMQVFALLLALLLPGPGLVLGWLVAAWAVGRGLFMAAAMRRMNRAQAATLYRRRRLAVLVQGGLVAAAGLVPLLNLLAPVLGVAAMVHVLHAPAAQMPQRHVPGA